METDFNLLGKCLPSVSDARQNCQSRETAIFHFLFPVRMLQVSRAWRIVFYRVPQVRHLDKYLDADKPCGEC